MLYAQVMVEDEDDTLVLEALKSGSFLVLKNPLTIDELMHVRQHVIRDRINKNNKCQNKSKIRNAAVLEESIQDKRNLGSKRKDRDEPTKHVVGTYHDSNLVYESAEDAVADDSIKKKCMDWTHNFMRNSLMLSAWRRKYRFIFQRCYPKEILERMGVPRLTRRQVASHLQTHANANIIDLAMVVLQKLMPFFYTL
ncbi:hypothetical protein L6452_08412 [Arctium lappa]|uniref:Uncharacterized protein n=1 Tax=Arctium lappa TaxID=4217 RepID=A0ACB9DHI4_ARCLA|nr:hypothetical protein L6452_08412 [Arctium lappa]